MATWEIRCYGFSKDVNEIRAWYDQQSPKVRGKFYSRLKTLAQLGLSEWKLPLFRWLRRECAPLGELRFEVQNVQHLYHLAHARSRLRAWQK
jgi:hypothetical protein